MNKRTISLILCLIIFIVFDIEAQDLSPLTDRINRTRDQVKLIVQAVIGLAALGGGLYAYFKVQSDDGGSGKKAIGNFVLALIFGSALITIIEVFI